MRITRPRYGRVRRDLRGAVPQIGFAAATFSAFAAWTGLIVTVPFDLVMPLVATIFLAFALGFGIVGWRTSAKDPMRVTYTDVAGALTLIGLFAASTIDPDQLVRLVEHDITER